MNKHNNQFDYDVAILGAGSAGFAAARTASIAGLRTVVIEGGAEVEGLCIRNGCMPTKTLLFASEVMRQVRRAETWGVRAENVGFDFTKVMSRKNALIKDFADDRRKELLGGTFVFIRARAAFIDSHSVTLDDAKTLSAAHFVIATGSRVAPPPLPQLREVGYLTSDDALKLTKLPQSLIVLGGGAVAVELSQFFARFGVNVTMIQRGAHLLRDFDIDAQMEIEKVFHREGIKLFANTKLLNARRDGLNKAISFEHQSKTVSVCAEEILFALGRAPNTASLNLKNAGVNTESGRIVANENMQTSAPHIYAAGDCAGPHEVVHLAVQQGEIAAHNIVNPNAPRKMDYRLLMAVVFIEPHAAVVGLTEKAATAQSIPFLAARYRFSDHGKSLIMDATDGFVKLLADSQSGEILGGACVGPLGGELIHEIVAAMAKRMTAHELAAMPHYHPTLAEIWTYPAAELANQIPQSHGPQ